MKSDLEKYLQRCLHFLERDFRVTLNNVGCHLQLNKLRYSCKGWSIFPYGFLNANNIKIQVGGWVRRYACSQYGFIVMLKLECGWVGQNQSERSNLDIRTAKWTIPYV